MGTSRSFGTVMLYDRSRTYPTQVFGGNRMLFEAGMVLQIVVDRCVNNALGMGGVRSAHICFSLIGITISFLGRKWSAPVSIIHCSSAPLKMNQPPPSLGPVTRICSRRDRNPTVRYTRKAMLGSGQPGQVFRVVDQSGRRRSWKTHSNQNGTASLRRLE